MPTFCHSLAFSKQNRGRIAQHQKPDSRRPGQEHPSSGPADCLAPVSPGGLSSCVEVVLSVVSQQSVSTEYTWGIIRDLPILHKAGAGAGLLVDPTTIWLQVDVHVEYHKGLLHFHHS